MRQRRSQKTGPGRVRSLSAVEEARELERDVRPPSVSIEVRWIFSSKLHPRGGRRERLECHGTAKSSKPRWSRR